VCPNSYESSKTYSYSENARETTEVIKNPQNIWGGAFVSSLTEKIMRIILSWMLQMTVLRMSTGS
jgi:hypothetical protein